MLLDPEALQAVVAKESKELTDEEIDKLISHFRTERERFIQNETAGKPARAIKGTTPTKKAALAAQISDIDIEI